MKNISITKSGQKQITKEVCMGNGRRKQFTANASPGYFVINTNRFLTKCLVSINNVLTDSYREYREIWFVTTNAHHGNRINEIGRQQKIIGFLHAAEEILDKFSFSDAGSNDPYFAFIDLYVWGTIPNNAPTPLPCNPV